jgi:hypothetical protein
MGLPAPMRSNFECGSQAFVDPSKRRSASAETELARKRALSWPAGCRDAQRRGIPPLRDWRQQEQANRLVSSLMALLLALALNVIRPCVALVASKPTPWWVSCCIERFAVDALLIALIVGDHLHSGLLASARRAGRNHSSRLPRSGNCPCWCCYDLLS